MGLGVLPVRFASLAVYRPRTRETLSDLTDVEARNGVSARYRAGEDETASLMAAEALRATGDLNGIERLIVGSIMPEQPIPTTAILTARRLGFAPGLTTFDINATCLSFLAGVESAALAIAAGQCRKAAVVAVDMATHGLNPDDEETRTLFGDGAAAATLEKSNGDSAILAIDFASHPDGADLCVIRAGGSHFNAGHPPPAYTDYLFAMKGHALARMAIRLLPPFLDKLLAKAGVALKDIACIIPHQASRLGLDYFKHYLGEDAPPIVDILAGHGNQVTASIPFAFHEAVSSGMLKRGEVGLAIGTAAGVSIGGMVFRY